MKRKSFWSAIVLTALATFIFVSCSSDNGGGGVGSGSDAASQVFVPPGEKDAFYNFVSGGFSGQLAVYGLPSGRLFRVIPQSGAAVSWHCKNPTNDRRR